MTAGVGTIEELSNIITGAPFEINGDGFGSGITSPTGTYTELVSIDTASELDQIALTRDSNPGTVVFEDPEGTIQIFDADNYRTGSAAHTIGPDNYSKIDQTFDESHVINVLTIKYVEKIKTGKKATRKVELGLVFEDSASITKYGPRKKTVTVHKKADFSEDYALKVFAKNADPDPVPASVTIPVNEAADLLPGYEDGTYVGSKVDVVLPDGVTTYTCRIEKIQHDITPTRWMVQVFLRNQDLIQRPVSDRMAVTTEVANTPDGTVLTAHLDDQAVTTAKIGDAAVTEAQLADGAVTAAKTDFTVNDIGGHKFTTASTAPSSPAAGDFWVDSGNGNELKTWNGSAWVSIQDAAISAAQDAADDAQTTADGKNKVTYSTSTPGTTANDAGDIWFQTSGSTIIGQWRGNGGTSWTSVTLTNSVISTLDAGKITTGTLSASRIGAGSITSTMLASNSVVAGKIAAGAIDAMTITGPVIQTDSSGNRLVIRDDGSAGIIEFDTGVSGNTKGSINPGVHPSLSVPRIVVTSGTRNVVGTVWTDPAVVTLQPGSAGTGGTVVLGAESPDPANTTHLLVLGHIETSSFIQSNGDLGVAGTATLNGSVLIPNVTSGGSINANINPTNGLVRIVTSSRRYKENIEPYQVDVETALKLMPQIYQRKDRTEGDPEHEVGFIAEDAHDLGLEPWVTYGKGGAIESFDYAKWTLALQATNQQQAQQIQDQTTRIEALEARLAALEAKQ